MQIELLEADRHALMPLFLISDDSARQIARYIDLGEVLVATEGNDALGHIQIVPTSEVAVLEIKSLAVRVDRQGQGIGAALVAKAVEWCRMRGTERIVLSTATADIGNLRFYQRRGFRMTHIVPDAFCAATGYPDDIVIDGIPLRDQVFFEMRLGAGM